MGKENNYKKILQNAYNKILIEYLMKETNLAKYDEYLANSSLNYQRVHEDLMDDYQYDASKFLNYFYVRNNLFVENLSGDNLKQLEELINEEDYEKKKGFIEKTLKTVITDKGLGENYNLIFGIRVDPRFFAPNGTLVLGFRYDEFADDEEPDEISEKKEDELELIIPRLAKEIEHIINVPTRIYQYDDYTVEERETKSKEI